MGPQIGLEQESGGVVQLMLPEPGDFPSFYVFSMEFSGSVQFWQLLEGLMGAVGRPVCNFQTLRRQTLDSNPGKLTSSAQQKLLLRPGYGFGMFFDVLAPLRDVFASASRKLLFLRDPRDMILARYRHLQRQSGDKAAGACLGLGEFLQSPEVDRKSVV